MFYGHVNFWFCLSSGQMAKMTNFVLCMHALRLNNFNFYSSEEFLSFLGCGFLLYDQLNQAE